MTTRLTRIQGEEVPPTFLSEVAQLRFNAWYPSKDTDFNEKEWIDVLDRTASHRVIKLNGSLVAACRATINARVEYARLAGCSSIIGATSTSKRVLDLERLGFKKIMNGRPSISVPYLKGRENSIVCLTL